MSKMLSDLVPVVLEKSKERKISWRPETPEMFVAEVGKNRTLVIFQDDIDVHLSLRDSTNAELEGISTEKDFFGTRAKLRETYDLARRQALKLDEVIDEVKQTLLSL
ncbi:MAG: hypothetical protein NBV67_04065 [Tagaea sp.]|nr:hypothetical protein [Tagaea sp.]